MNKKLNDIKKFLELISKTKNIGFFSIDQQYRSLNKDLSLSSHPHENPDKIEMELQNKFLFVSRVYIFNGKLSARPKNSDLLIGFIYSNTDNTSKLIKDNN